MDHFADLDTQCTDFKGTIPTSTPWGSSNSASIFINTGKTFFKGLKIWVGEEFTGSTRGKSVFSNVAPIRWLIFFEDQIANEGCNQKNLSSC